MRILNFSFKRIPYGNVLKIVQTRQKTQRTIELIIIIWHLFSLLLRSDRYILFPLRAVYQKKHWSSHVISIQIVTYLSLSFDAKKRLYKNMSYYFPRYRVFNVRLNRYILSNVSKTLGTHNNKNTAHLKIFLRMDNKLVTTRNQRLPWKIDLMRVY